MSDLVPTAVIDIVVDPFFGGTILEAFVCGMYTLLAAQAIWKLHRKSNKRVYLFSLFALWIAVILNFASDWASSNALFIVHSSSPMSMLNDVGVPLNIARYIPGPLAMFISDGILIWRCNILWSNIYILVSLIFLLFATTALQLAGDFANITGREASMILTLFSTFTSLVTILSATLLISWKVVSVTRRSHMRYSYDNVIHILVESAALVSILQLALTLLALVDCIKPWRIRTTGGMVFSHIEWYLVCIQIAIIVRSLGCRFKSVKVTNTQGIGPTLIAFRAAEEPSHPRIKKAHQNNIFAHLAFRRTPREVYNNSRIETSEE